MLLWLQQRRRLRLRRPPAHRRPHPAVATAPGAGLPSQGTTSPSCPPNSSSTPRNRLTPNRSLCPPGERLHLFHYSAHISNKTAHLVRLRLDCGDGWDVDVHLLRPLAWFAEEGMVQGGA